MQSKTDLSKKMKRPSETKENKTTTSTLSMDFSFSPLIAARYKGKTVKSVEIGGEFVNLKERRI